MQAGAAEFCENYGITRIELEAGDENLAFTPLMKELKNNSDYTVAQFGQAIGAVHFAAEILHRDF